MRKSSSIASGPKQGSLKAILPVSSSLATRDSHRLRKSKSNSPVSCLKFRFSPESSSPGRRSPASCKGMKCKSPGYRPGCLGYIRRTASLDAIYLKGQRGKDSFAMESVTLKVNKATQTEDLGNDKKHRHSEFSGDDVKYDKYIRHRLQKVGKDAQNGQRLGLRLVSPSLQGEYGCGGSQTPPGSVLPALIRSGPQSPIQGFPINITTKTSLGRALMRNSIEGLNQEIERLVLKDIDDRIFNCSSIPEGHRAPLADILRHTRSVNTQTPGNDETECDFFGASDPPSRDSSSPMVCGNIDLCTPPNYIHGSRGSSPDDFNRFGTSPHINKFLAREPPDGCEKVNLRLEESRRQRAEFENVGFVPLKPVSTSFQFKPSLGSAFHPLQSSNPSSAFRCHSTHSMAGGAAAFNRENSAEDAENVSQG